jgi:hypothetical protein
MPTGPDAASTLVLALMNAANRAYVIEAAVA